METTNYLPTPNEEDISNFFIAIRSGYFYLIAQICRPDERDSL